eukprot:CAMPEP_0194516844 /NCGR_PEP_ID=MMETSP0253-20130528/49848_1 /TAXON_ID=2966 /ORGANISM="Noctiluca scintillans" /LENGTH=120 /DNA_ID=CAMNT_0039360749 /DNA_START=1299 /DNA_END=1661 /DNA_ORIENTATION=+
MLAALTASCFTRAASSQGSIQACLGSCIALSQAFSMRDITAHGDVPSSELCAENTVPDSTDSLEAGDVSSPSVPAKGTDSPQGGETGDVSSPSVVAQRVASRMSRSTAPSFASQGSLYKL